ncbi:PREDICTED: A-kinase anchor protein 13-like [Chrysochloris asiatica]|uniref:A-kinase anchor protein 13-like n=1 Tax=Chrysochloris asiatica TaxID=185453 RepID=A0A9B0TMV2_CHRAS|nr:PREDICTED: A-kinase anchor protein 13-like [Chrysochloris asiatica]
MWQCALVNTHRLGNPMEPLCSDCRIAGDCVVTVLLAEEDKVEDDVVFYLVFSGSSLHHCASTRKISSDTLETIAPGHDCCETVKVLLCASKEGLPVFVVAEEDFHFIHDEAYDAAQFLATSAGNQQALNFTRFLDRSGPPSGDVNSLDEKVALAFRHLKLPAEWNVLGADQTSHGKNVYKYLSVTIYIEIQDAGSPACCHESPAKGQIDCSSVVSGIVTTENTDSSCEEKNQGLQKQKEEVETAPTVDGGTVSDQYSCLPNMPDSGQTGTGDLPACGNRKEETGTKSSRATADQESLSSGDHIVQEDLATALSTGQQFSGGELTVSSTADVTGPETSGDMEHGLLNPETTLQKNMLECPGCSGTG